MTAAARRDTRAMERRRARFLKLLGPGLITGAADDDPAGIGTYSQAGAQLGFGISWTLVLTFPLMAAIQEICARVGRTTGRGLAGNIGRHYPNWLLQVIVALLLIANTVNIGADLGAMGDALSMVIGGPGLLYVALFGAFSVTAQIFVLYERYVAALKWLTLSLFAYVAVLAVVDVPWGEALRGLVIPSISWNRDFLTTIVAILGTTISPYLFFWQASQEAEEIRIRPARTPLARARRQAPFAFARIRTDTMIGMAFSNLIGIAIIMTTAATLGTQHVSDVETSTQAAEALRPIAGDFARVIFALGIVGTGLLAVPVLAGSAAFAVGESRRWPVGLSRMPKEAVAFYLTIGIATVVGAALNFTPLNPMRALFWSAVINGVVAMPLMIILMLMAAKRSVMGEFAVKGTLRALGWVSTAVMGACVAGMVAGWIS